MKYPKKIAFFTGLLLGTLLYAANAHAQVSGSLWKVLSGELNPVVSSWGLEIPSLANNNCIGTDSNGLFIAGTCTGGGGGSGGGTWATTTSTVSGHLINHPNNNTDVVVIGGSSTTTAPWWYDPNSGVKIQYINGSVGIGSTSPYRALSINGSAVFTGGDLLLSTITSTSTASLHDLTLTSQLTVGNGGTGQNTFTASQLLYGNGTNALSSVATSSFTPSGFPANYSGTFGNFVGGANGTWTWWGISTSTTPTKGDLPYWTGVNTLGDVATSAPSIGSVLTYSGTLGAFVGGSAGTFGIANGAVTNAMLANSTISGISLGSNLNSLSNDGATLSGSSYNGSATVSNWAINLAHANTWSALQQFNGNASSTKLSAYQAWFGGTATTTIGSDGKLTIGNITGSTQCLHADTNGVVSGTGSDCGAGGGGSDPFTHTSVWGISPLSATSTTLSLTGNTFALIASSTLEVSSTTGPQLFLSDQTNIPWFFRSINNNLYIGTSTTANATSSIPAFSLLPVPSGQSQALIIGTSSIAAFPGDTVEALMNEPAGNGQTSSSTLDIGDTSTTSSVSQIQLNGSNGTTYCIFVNGAGMLTTQSGSCK